MGSLNYTLISPPTHSLHQSVRKYWQLFLHLKYMAKLRMCPRRHPTSISSHLGGRLLSFHPYFLPSILYIAARVNFSRQHWITSLVFTRKPVLQWRPAAIKISSMSEGVLRAPALSPFFTMLLYTVSWAPGALCLQLLPLPPLAFPSLVLCITGFFSFFTCQLTFHLTGDTFPGHWSLSLIPLSHPFLLLDSFTALTTVWKVWFVYLHLCLGMYCLCPLITRQVLENEDPVLSQLGPQGSAQRNPSRKMCWINEKNAVSLFFLLSSVWLKTINFFSLSGHLFLLLLFF